MRTIAGKSPLTLIVMFPLLLCGATALPAIRPVNHREGPNGDLSAYTEAGSSPSAPTGQMTPPAVVAGSPMDPSYTLVGVLSRARDSVSTSHPDARHAHPSALDLWSSRVKAPAAQDDAEARLALRDLIEQVRSVRFEDRTPPAMTPPVKPEPTPQSAGKPDNTQRMRPQEISRTTPAASEESWPLPAKARKTLETLGQNPGRAKDPLAMAELLFLSGRATEAVPFYQKALEQTPSDDPTSQADRAWILFQLGNCLRETDTAKAQQIYAKLIAEHPGSPWTDLAKAHERLLTWHQQDRPRELVASRQP